MIQEFLVTSITFLLTSAPIVSTVAPVQDIHPLQGTLQAAMGNLQENVETISTLGQLQNSFIASISAPHLPGEKLFTEEQEQLIQKVKEEIQFAQVQGNVDQAMDLDTSLTALLNAYALAKGSTDIVQTSLSVAAPPASSIILAREEAAGHMLRVRTAFVESVDTLSPEKIERIESELMTAEQMLLTVSAEGGNDARMLLVQIEQYIYHATFLLKSNV